MPHTTDLFVRRTLVLLMAGVIGCGSDLLLPDPPGGGQNVALTKVDGDQQTGTVGEPLAAPLVVQVLSAREQPVSGRKVAFGPTSDPAAGAVTPDTAVTNDAGQATARWVLGTSPGPQVVVARLVGGEADNQVAQFRAAALAAAPDTLRAASALAQPGQRKREVAKAPVVHVVDRFGNPVQNISVAWQVSAGGGKVDEPVTETDADGNASAHWTLGDRLGFHQLTAAVGSVSGSPVTFTATVLF
jgi:Big-like domain-containing protein